MLGKDEVQGILRRASLFSGCSEATLAELAKIAVESNPEKGQVLYEPGDKAVYVYVLVSGIVTFINKAGLEFLNVQRTMGRSMVFGWIALVPGYPNRIGTAQCLEESKILALNGEAVLRILDADPASGYAVMKGLAQLIASTFVDKPT